MIEAKTKIERYESYRDSGIEWLGEIPEHWKIESFKHILTERNEKNAPIRTKEILSLSIDKGVTLYAEKTTNLDRFKDDFSKYKLAQKGDLVFNSMNMIVGAVGVSDYFGCVSPVYYTYYGELNNSDTSKFYEYLFRSKIVQGVLYSLGKGLMAIDRGDGKYNTLRLKVSRDDLRSMKLPFPNSSEQTQIVQFLNDKTTKIEDAIAIKQQQISLLKERKQILIHKAVTRGLDDSVALKDSGVEWIGEIPEHWNCVKFKFIIRTKARLGWKGLKAAEYVDKSNFGFLSTPNIKTRDIDFNSAYFITKRRYYESPEIMLQKGDVLLVKDGSTLGISNIVRDLPFKCTVNSSIAVLRVMNGVNLLPEYLNYFLKSETCQRIIDKKKDGMGVPHLFQSDINNFSVPIFSIEEQSQISEYIEKSSIKLDEAIGLKQQEIAKLREYKSSLINGVVTGKVKVC
ncbi:restriction endonuclease subunit S [Pseudozobellia sp. WGM2]|uniref:restriction endonuclease subunit S n=1 Tax=Pseudozobellia sp. WGM2 TaxID=2787625 RepID=UPI001ADF28E4|nr:restriction endonuclease subunit S [Pseudozobellia sp. WGM2]